MIFLPRQVQSKPKSLLLGPWSLQSWFVLNGGYEEQSTKECKCARQPPEEGRAIFRNSDLCEVRGDLRNLMRHTNEDERADDDVECRVPGDKDQDAPGVCCQPDVVLTNEQL